MKKALVFKPEYYENFSCKGSKCQQTCCCGWDITLTKDEYRKSKHLLQSNEAFSSQTYFSKRPASRRSNNSYADIILDQNQHCPFLTQEQLCGLQCHFGKEALSDICNWFPRRLFENGNFHPSGHPAIHTSGGRASSDKICCAALSPGCEKVLEMLPTDRSLTFSVQEEYLGDDFPKSISLEKIYPNNCYPYITYFQDIYSMGILILQAQDVSLEDRITLLGIGLEKIIQLGEKGKWDSIPAYIESYLSTLSELDDVSTLIPSLSPNLPAVFNNFLMADNGSNEIAYQNIMKRVKEYLQISYEIDGMDCKFRASSFYDYEKKKEAFEQIMSTKPYFMENVVLAIFTFKNLPFSGGIIGGIWENYIYLCWVYSSLKFVLTICHEDISSHDDLISLCVPLLRRWAHNNELAKIFIKTFKENSSDTLAHMAVLIKSC